MSRYAGRTGTETNKQIDKRKFKTWKLPGEEGRDAVTYWVFETDSEGNRIDKELFSYEVSGEGKVTLSKDNLTETVKITNTIKEKETEEETEETEEETEIETESETEKEIVETGDESPIEIYVLLVLVAAVVLVTGVIRSRKKQ